MVFAPKKHLTNKTISENLVQTPTTGTRKRLRIEYNLESFSIKSANVGIIA
jgi:hypothetical protein